MRSISSAPNEALLLLNADIYFCATKILMQHFEGITRIPTYFSDSKYCDTTMCSSAGHFSNLTGWIEINQTWTYLTLQCIGVRSAIWLISFQLRHIMIWFYAQKSLTGPKLGMKQKIDSYVCDIFCKLVVKVQHQIMTVLLAIFLHQPIIWFRAEQRFPRDLVCATYLEQVPPLSFVSCWSGVMF